MKKILIAFITFIMTSICSVEAQYVLELGYDDGVINRIKISDSFTPQVEEKNIEGYEQETLTLKSTDGTVHIPVGGFFGWSLKNGQGELIEVGPFSPEGDIENTYSLFPAKGKLVIEGLKGEDVYVYENEQSDEGRQIEVTNPLMIDFKGSIRMIIIGSIELIFTSK